MRIHNSDKAIAWITLLSGLTISAVAIYYSVAGLMAIFSAAVIPIVVMGVALEISKLAATVWLKQNWKKAPNFIRGYLLAAIAILMLITSMGIFGFLSKAHSDQSLVSGDVQSKIAIYDEKIKTAKENIDANRKALKQMDEAVDQVMGRSQDEKGADKAVAIRRGQAKERTRLLSEITAEQKLITQLSEERAPIAAEVRKVEAEVGPIKYIASFVYGETNETILEKAVTWVIIIIVIVFDPLAVILLLASQYSFMWFRQQQEEDEFEKAIELKQEVAEALDAGEPLPEEAQADVTVVEVAEGDSPVGADVVGLPTVTEHEEKTMAELHPYLSVPFTHFTNLKPMVAQVEEYKEEEKEIEEAPHTEKEAMAKWKAENPNSNVKTQRKLLEQGVISELPWMKFIEIKPDYVEEAEKWADENPQTEEAQLTKEWADEKILTAGFDERPGDYITPPDDVSYMENVDGHQVKKVIEGYQQNAEQNESTIWQRVKKAKE